MTVPSSTSFLIAQQELDDARKDPLLKSVIISDLEKETLVFAAKMQTPIDDQVYLMDFKLDNYKEWPPLIEFIEPDTGVRGTQYAYPQGKEDGFFHGKPCICNPCSRKAFKDYGDLHKEWDINKWQQMQEVNSLTDLKSILKAIHGRIINPKYYQGRMGTK